MGGGSVEASNVVRNQGGPTRSFIVESTTPKRWTGGLVALLTSKSKLLVSYADHVVGVHEHSQGEHVWQAVYSDQSIYRERPIVFDRTYESDADQYEAYDGMFAHDLSSMERVQRAQTWETTADVLEAVQRAYAEP